jgi:hypothetical protein
LIRVSKEFSKKEKNQLKQSTKKLSLWHYADHLCHRRMLALQSMEETITRLYLSMFFTAGSTRFVLIIIYASLIDYVSVGFSN